jgi:hypothetical protein
MGKKKNNKKNNNNSQKGHVFLRSIFDLYKILTATLLVIFVPQTCHDGTRVCSFAENFHNLDSYNSFALYFNFFTSICFMIYYFIEIYRERLFIRLLDINKSDNISNYRNDMKLYPKINSKIIETNELFFYFNCFLLCIFISNIIISIFVLTRYYLNDLTIFISISNTMLIADKQLRSFYVAIKSYNHNIPYSMYKTNLVYFNSVDLSIKKKRKKKILKKMKKMKEDQDLIMDM